MVRTVRTVRIHDAEVHNLLIAQLYEIIAIIVIIAIKKFRRTIYVNIEMAQNLIYLIKFEEHDYHVDHFYEEDYLDQVDGMAVRLHAF